MSQTTFHNMEHFTHQIFLHANRLDATGVTLQTIVKLPNCIQVQKKVADNYSKLRLLDLRRDNVITINA